MPDQSLGAIICISTQNVVEVKTKSKKSYGNDKTLSVHSILKRTVQLGPFSPLSLTKRANLELPNRSLGIIKCIFTQTVVEVKATYFFKL